LIETTIATKASKKTFLRDGFHGLARIAGSRSLKLKT